MHITLPAAAQCPARTSASMLHLDQVAQFWLVTHPAIDHRVTAALVLLLLGGLCNVPSSTQTVTQREPT